MKFRILAAIALVAVMGVGVARGATTTQSLAPGDQLTVTCSTNMTGTVSGSQAVLSCAPACVGVQVYPGATTLQDAEAANPAGTTFCVNDGTYNMIGGPAVLQMGDDIKGVYYDGTRPVLDGGHRPKMTTILDASAVDATGTQVGPTIEGVQVSGAYGPGAATDPSTSLGRGIDFKGNLTVRDVLATDNDNTGLNGGAPDCCATLTVNDSAFNNNGSTGYLGSSASGLKGGSGNLSMFITNSTASSNTGNGFWADACVKRFEVHDSTATNNTRDGVRWETSKPCAVTRSGLVTNSVIQNNNTSLRNANAGITIRQSENLEVSFNTFGGNGNAAVRMENGTDGTVVGTNVHDNTLNGDPINGCAMAGVTCSGNM